MFLEGFQQVTAILDSGVYALTYRGEVVYVGQSRNCLKRLNEHKNAARRRLERKPGWAKVKAIPFDGAWIRPTPMSQLTAVEREMIAKYRPRYNALLVPRLPLPAAVIAALTPRVKGFVRRV